MSQIVLSIIFIILEFLKFVISTTNKFDGEIACTLTEAGNVHGIPQKISVISKDNYTSIIHGDVPVDTRHMPDKPKDVSIDVTPHNNTMSITWYPPNVGRHYVRYFLLVNEEVAEFSVNYQYILVHVTRLKKTNSKIQCLYKLGTGTEKLTSTVWAFGNIRYTDSGHMTAEVDSESKSQTVSRNTNIQYLRKREEVAQCICSVIKLTITAFPSSLMFKIKSEAIPKNTQAKVHLMKISNDVDGDIQQRVITVTINRYFDGNFKINTTGEYYIRFQRLCRSDSPVHCGKRRPDVIRSESVTVIAAASSAPPTVGQNRARLLQQHISRTPPTRAALNVVTEPVNDDEYVNHVVQLAIIISVCGATAMLEIALIIKACSVINPRRKISNVLYKYPTCVSVDIEGKTSTKILNPMRVPIIFTKDTGEHVSRVYQLKSSLRRLGVDAVPYDESNVPDMMMNWIQVGENIATQSDVVILIVSPQLLQQCKRRDDPSFNRPNLEADINGPITTVLHKLPAVVVNSLKVGNISSGKTKPRVMCVFLSQNKTSIKQMVSTMRQDHPSLMYDDVLLHYNSNDNEINLNDIQRLADKIKS